MTSSRLAADGDYRVADLAGDLAAVMERPGSGGSRCSVTRSRRLALWLAHRTTEWLVVE